MQKPTWVRPPSSYPHGSASSLSVAFEDPDRSKMKVLLTECYLYAFGNRASVKKWKYHLKKNKDNSNNNANEHNQASDSNDDEEDVEITLQQTETSQFPITSPSSSKTLASNPASNSITLFPVTQPQTLAKTATRHSERKQKPLAL